MEVSTKAVIITVAGTTAKYRDLENPMLEY